MKSLELNKFSVSELTNEEKVDITGGSFWSVLGNIAGAIVAVGLVIGVILGIGELND